MRYWLAKVAIPQRVIEEYLNGLGLKEKTNYLGLWKESI